MAIFGYGEVVVESEPQNHRWVIYTAEERHPRRLVAIPWRAAFFPHILQSADWETQESLEEALSVAMQAVPLLDDDIEKLRTLHADIRNLEPPPRRRSRDVSWTVEGEDGYGDVDEEPEEAPPRPRKKKKKRKKKPLQAEKEQLCPVRKISVD